MHPILDIAPPLLAEEEGPPTQKELNPGAIHIISLPHYGRHGEAGFHHLFAGTTSLHDLGLAQASSCSTQELLVSHRFLPRTGVSGSCGFY
jgi:hypothetical protein